MSDTDTPQPADDRPTPTGNECPVCGASTWGVAILCGVHEAEARARRKPGKRAEPY